MVCHVIPRCRRKCESSWRSLLVMTELPRLTTIPFLISKRSCWSWRPVTTLGFSHCALADIVYGNPTRPSLYPNPDKFDPERWLNNKGKIWDDIKFPSYGFGRRICPGRHIADRSVFIDIVLLLWSFGIPRDLENPTDKMGFVDGVILYSKPFTARFQPRFGDEA
ncbi:cytochrome P450 [Suillus subalutaceus]|uniref:cytochrome P450 n=1 Tax=Suillus subalutaceus TaxID=48586 RepID=UPI001B866016|nr:cytochrome P450 [Suillus subalutaceus]KAG1836173.1 cytochrome P450 [Suillus subalutaceus]